jgi:hypothetical protein
MSSAIPLESDLARVRRAMPLARRRALAAVFATTAGTAAAAVAAVAAGGWSWLPVALGWGAILAGLLSSIAISTAALPLSWVPARVAGGAGNSAALTRVILRGDDGDRLGPEQDARMATLAEVLWVTTLLSAVGTLVFGATTVAGGAAMLVALLTTEGDSGATGGFAYFLYAFLVFGGVVQLASAAWQLHRAQVARRFHIARSAQVRTGAHTVS